MTEIENELNVAAGRVGTALSNARKNKKLELADIAERTRIPLRHLDAIETSDYDRLPALTYCKGFVKSYAKLVDLDGDKLADELQAELSETRAEYAEEPQFEFADPSRVPSRLLAWIGIGAAILFAIIYLIWRNAPGMDERASLAAGSDEAAQVSTENTAASAARPPASPVGKQVVLAATDEVWIKVSERGGETLFMNIMKKGERYVVPDTAKDPVIVTGRPEVLNITVGGVAIPTLGKPSQTIRDASLQPQSLLDRRTPPPVAAPQAGTQ